MDISIVTINYNSTTETLGLIDSIIKFTSKDINFEIIVVDNNSTESELSLLENKLPLLPNLKLIKSKINLGFGAGNMMGYQFANNPTFVAFINNDVVFKEDSLLVLLNYMQKNRQVGVCGPNMEYTNPNEYDLKSFSHFHDLWMNVLGTKIYEKLFKKNPIKKTYNAPIKVDFVMGSFLFFCTEDFTEVGGFDTTIFLYYEEMDICLRLKKIGKQTHYIPNTSYIHNSGFSAKKINNGINLLKEQQISYHHVFKKNYGLLKYSLLYCMVLIKHTVKAMFSPKIYLPLLKLHLQFNSITKSLKYNQKIKI